MKAVIKSFFLFVCSALVAQNDVINTAPESAIDESFFEFIPKVDYGDLLEQSGATSFTTDYSPSGSYWLDPSDTDEEHVYLAKLQHDADTEENSWELRIGQGGQIYSFKSAYGEGIPPQSKEHSTWNDEVWQAVSVNTSLLNRDFTSAFYYVHGAGAYNYDGVEQTLYSPLMASFYNETEKAYYVTNWGTQAHIPTLYKSGILYTTKYKEIGEGVLEVTYVINNFGEDQINHINAPWGGVRASSLRGKFLSSPDGSIAVNNAQTGSEEGALTIDIDETGGYVIWSADTVNSTAPSLGLVFGNEIKLDELADHGLSNVYMRLAQVGGDANPRDYTLFTLIPKLLLNKGETFYYRTYYINGTRDFVQEKSNLLNPYVDYGFIEASETETPVETIYTSELEGAFTQNFGLFTSPIEQTTPIFLMKNTETGELYISPDAYYNVVTSPLENPYLEGDANFETYEDRITYKLHESSIEYVRLLGYGFRKDMSQDDSYILLDDLVLDDGKLVITNEFVDQIWVKRLDETCTDEIIPRAQIYGELTNSDTYIEITEGDSLIFKPQVSEEGVTSTGAGTWTWQDPDANGHSGRVLTFEPITVSDAGIYSVTYQSGGCEVEEKFEVVVNEVVTGLTNSDLLNGITIYPNPSSEIFHLKNAKDKEVEIYNSFNQLLIRTTATSNDFQIDLNSYAQGVYFLQIKEQDISVTRRIIKK